MIKVELVNKSSVVSTRKLQNVSLALDSQLLSDFNPIWGIQATVLPYLPNKVPSNNSWQLWIMDTTDELGAGGYHCLTKTGKPLGKIFAKTEGPDWTKVASHELLEILADPYINLSAEIKNGIFYGYEVCDPVQAYSYLKKGVKVSDFTTPQWFEAGKHPKGTKYSFLGKPKNPFQIMKGGYVSKWTCHSGWTTTDHSGKKIKAEKDSREAYREQ